MPLRPQQGGRVKPGGQREFYVPYKGQVSAADFIKFYEQRETLFQEEATKEGFYH